MTEIRKVVQETMVGKPEDEIQTFEKCLRLVGSNRTRKEQELGFCLMSRMIIKCSSQTLRAVQSRLANRLAHISDHFQLCGSLYTRELLVRNPQAGELHSPIVFKIILNCMDAAAQTSDPNIRGLAAELFGLRISNQNLTMLLNTLEVLLSATKIKNVSNDLLQLRTLGVSSHRDSLTSLLFEVLALSLGYASKPGLFVERKDIIQVIELGINNPKNRSVAFACLRSMCVNTKYSLIPMIGRIVSTLISELESPDVDLIKTLAFISKTFGPVTSTLYKHFYVIFTALKHPIHEQCYGEHVGNLLSSIIESAASLIKPEVFATVQKAVCESAIMHPDSSIYLQLLAAFLTLNNEYVPSPLQVARVISSRTRNTSEHSHRLRALCNVASRPRTTDLANVKAKKTLVLKEENTIQAPTAASEDLKEKEEVEQEFEEMETEDKEEEIVPVVVEKKIEEVPEASSRKKKNSESSTTATSTVAKKKKKSVVNDVKTNLLEGEASVDDILNLFDMS
ncbi:Fanconi anemia group I protein [Caenorhabditis elegans]|uniref:Fanconi anemia group I protein n=1 Tax=Caenorhabditis elegans TaxID=6239 RepID=P90790_CAEEL|nr:Fanconi anemia group I protein [Caenorhabditis elegans]CAA98117.1 Fanconi anemia group I protein [Caenorhabditis elegans]|eukprot:NP_492118.1 Uncharacterized protein CELE_D2030.3 [Caenorhabditis elegans]